jgi:hypothetical protein
MQAMHQYQNYFIQFELFYKSHISDLGLKNKMGYKIYEYEI